MTDPAEIARCETCRFRYPDKREEWSSHGQCRRYPPSIWSNVTLNGEMYFEQRWPWMAPTDWCGEHSPHNHLMKGKDYE